MLKRSDVTMDKILQDVEDARQLALKIEQPSAAVQASQLQGKLVGLLVDRKETGGPGDFAQAQTSADVIDQVRREHGDQAAELVKQLIAARNASQGANPGPDQPEIAPADLPGPGDAIN